MIGDWVLEPVLLKDFRCSSIVISWVSPGRQLIRLWEVGVVHLALNIAFSREICVDDKAVPVAEEAFNLVAVWVWFWSTHAEAVLDVWRKVCKLDFNVTVNLMLINICSLVVQVDLNAPVCIKVA